MLTPFGSMIVGFLAGIISVLGFKFLSVSVHQPARGLSPTRWWETDPPIRDGVLWASTSQHRPVPLFSPSWNPNWRSRTPAGCTTCTACPGSWAPSSARWRLPWQPQTFTGRGDYLMPSSLSGLDKWRRRWALVCLSGWRTSSLKLRTEAWMRPSRAASRRCPWPSRWASLCWGASS